MLRPKEAAAEIEYLEGRVGVLNMMTVGANREQLSLISEKADILREKIVEIKQQYPSGS